MFSPQPALPRRQMPFTSSARSVIFLAASTMKSQVGASGMVSPAFSIRSLRYMTKEDFAVERRGVELAIDGQAAAQSPG